MLLVVFIADFFVLCALYDVPAGMQWEIYASSAMAIF